MTDEDRQDLLAYNKALEEHLKNPVVYSQEEVEKMLKIDFKPRYPLRRYGPPQKAKQAPCGA